MDEEELYRKLRGRCPVSQLPLFDAKEYPNLQNELNKIKKMNGYYVKCVLKKIIDSNEGDEDSEWVYEEYVKLLTVGKNGPQEEDIIEYRICEEIDVKICEQPRLISGLNTTGLRTWEGALYLCLYMNKVGGCRNDEVYLELGAGTGIVSMFLYKWVGVRCGGNDRRKIYITDGDSELLDGRMGKNLMLNGMDGSGDIIRQRLIWAEDKNVYPVDVTKLIGADITYDVDSFGSLCECISTFLYGGGGRTGCRDMIISCTIRSEDTIERFIKECVGCGLEIECISDNDVELTGYIERELIYTKLIAPIRVYKISTTKENVRVQNM